MTTFAGVKAQKYHFDSYVQWFESIKTIIIEDAAIMKTKYHHSC